MELEQLSIQATVWKMIGGPITEGVIQMVDTRLSQMADAIDTIDRNVGGLMKEDKIKLPDVNEDDEDWEED